jgi:hypothetical protein
MSPIPIQVLISVKIKAKNIASLGPFKHSFLSSNISLKGDLHKSMFLAVCIPLICDIFVLYITGEIILFQSMFINFSVHVHFLRRTHTS